MIKSSTFNAKKLTSSKPERFIFLAPLLAFLLVFSVYLSPSASAHAKLESSTPSAGEVVTDLQEITLAFNEEVTPLSFKLSTKTQEIPISFTSDKVQSVTVALNKNTETPDNYFLAYQVVSADSHIISGVIPFVISNEKGTPSLTQLDNSSYESGSASQLFSTQTFILDRLLEFLSWLVFFIVLGLLFAGKPSLALPYMYTGTLLALLRLVGMYDTYGRNFFEINETYSGILILCSFLILLLAYFTKFGIKSNDVKHNKKESSATTSSLVVPILGSIIFSTQSFFSGHFTSSVIFSALNFTHLLGASLWFGALISILVKPTSINIVRSSKIATFSVTILIVATSFMFIFEVLPLLHLGQVWSNLIILKIVSLFLALTLGALNNVAVRKLAKNAPAKLSPVVRKIRTRTFLEVILLTFIIIFSASLSLNSPTKPTVVSQNIPQPETTMEEVTSMEPNLEKPSENIEPVTIAIDLDYNYKGVLTLSSAKSLTMSELELKVYDEFGVETQPIQAEYELYNEKENLSGFNSSFAIHDDHLMASFLPPSSGLWGGVLTVQIDDFTTVEGDFSFEVN